MFGYGVCIWLQQHNIRSHPAKEGRTMRKTATLKTTKRQWDSRRKEDLRSLRGQFPLEPIPRRIDLATNTASLPKYSPN